MTDRDRTLADRFSLARQTAEARLWALMEARGLHARDGWKIAEFTRESRDGSEIVLRPLHLWRESPSDLECVVCVHTDDGAVDTSCT